MGPLRLLNLDHPAKFLQLQRTAKIVQVVHRERRIFSGKLNIIIVAGLPDKFHQCGPGRQKMSADGWLSGSEQRAQTVMTHVGVSYLDLRRTRRHGDRPPKIG